ncbi:hypothetical protein PM082_017713 [Marasmius tenuissimus]|nr:hypothetical protein PM082_017713 [Marasmius tenuissimus]
MFYAGGGYNYAQETMELLHNLEHDWPSDSVQILLSRMLCNGHGRSNSFLEGDLVNEHYNDRIKERAHRTNASPATLSHHSPTAGHLQELSNNLFEDLGVEALNQRHHRVEQHGDVAKLTRYFISQLSLFRFDEDRETKHKMVDLFGMGIYRISRPPGGHAKHLIRQKLRLRRRGSLEEDIDETEAREAEIELEDCTILQGNHDYTILQLNVKIFTWK